MKKTSLRDKLILIQRLNEVVETIDGTVYYKTGWNDQRLADELNLSSRTVVAGVRKQLFENFAVRALHPQKFPAVRGKVKALQDDVEALSTMVVTLESRVANLEASSRRAA